MKQKILITKNREHGQDYPWEFRLPGQGPLRFASLKDAIAYANVHISVHQRCAA